mgnify:CR=1 FL=1
MEDQKYQEILNRLSKIEEILERIESQGGFGINTVSNILGDAIWSAIEYNLGLFKDNKGLSSNFPFLPENNT